MSHETESKPVTQFSDEARVASELANAYLVARQNGWKWDTWLHKKLIEARLRIAKLESAPSEDAERREFDECANSVKYTLAMTPHEYAWQIWLARSRREAK